MRYFHQNGLFCSSKLNCNLFLLLFSRHILQADNQRECNHWMECIEKTINNALNNSINSINNENGNDQLTNNNNNDQLSNSSYDGGIENEISISNGSNNLTLFIKPDLSSTYLNDSTSQDSFLSASNIPKHKRTLSQKYDIISV